MTSHEGILHNLRPHTESDRVLIANGDFLHITHIGDATLGSGSSKIILSDVLLVSDLERNLLSIGKLTTDYPVNCEFSDDDFVIKDRVTQRVLMEGTKQGNLYTIWASPAAFFSTRFRAVTSDLWHQRLGHPQVAVVANLRKTGLIKILSNKSATDICASCQLEKMSKLPFSGLSTVTFEAFDKLHINLQGPTPVSSINHFRYYCAIVDDFIKFIWLFRLKHKSEFFAQYLLFEKY